MIQGLCGTTSHRTHVNFPDTKVELDRMRRLTQLPAKMRPRWSYRDYPTTAGSPGPAGFVRSTQQEADCAGSDRKSGVSTPRKRDIHLNSGPKMLHSHAFDPSSPRPLGRKQ